MNEVNSKLLQIARNMISVQGIIFILKKFQVPLKRHFKVQHFSIERSVRTLTSVDGKQLDGLGTAATYSWVEALDLANFF